MMTFRFRFFIDVNDPIYVNSARFLHNLHDLFKSFFFYSLFVRSFMSVSFSPLFSLLAVLEFHWVIVNRCWNLRLLKWAASAEVIVTEAIRLLSVQ